MRYTEVLQERLLRSTGVEIVLLGAVGDWRPTMYFGAPEMFKKWTKTDKIVKTTKFFSKVNYVKEKSLKMAKWCYFYF